ncbi:MAG TPA: serine/threonine-protein kinase [Kofleriaceae bacterium]|nr:serine/threonine-protein kinase [Kofleriaceae bacterium]
MGSEGHDDEDGGRGSSEHLTRAETPKRQSKPKLQADSRLDRFRLGDVLGRGGMGEVFAAVDDTLGRDVAIKRVRGEQSVDLVRRFVREAKIQGCLDHPAIPPVHELGWDADGRPFLVMKRLSGTTLAMILRDTTRARSRESLLRAFVDACLAVEFAHAHGVIHRDIKPSNIMLGEFGEVYVLDWGIAKIVGDVDPRVAGVRQWSNDLGDETLEGAIVGTPGYIAPELLAGEEVDGRADVFALGCVLFEILSGSPPFTPGDRAVIGPKQPSVRAPDRDIPPELDMLCVEACARVDERVSSARALAERVQRYLDGDRDLAMRRELARKHFEKARAALDKDPGNAVAMREAGRALALDPELAEASALVTRLMLEPPATTPPELEKRIAAAEAEGARRHAGFAGLASLSYLIFVPVFLWIGMPHPSSLLVLFGCVAGLLVAGRHAKARGAHPVHYIVSTLLASTVIGWFSWGYSPALIAPGLACVTVMLLLAGPEFRHWRYSILTVLGLELGVFAPWLAMQLGWSRESLAVHGNELVVRMIAMTSDPEKSIPFTIGIALWCAGIVIFGALHARLISSGEWSAQRRLVVQAWRLSQLSPISAS